MSPKSEYRTTLRSSRRSRKSLPILESLEVRLALSLGPPVSTSPFDVDTHNSTDTDSIPVVARYSGGWVAVWADTVINGQTSYQNILAEMYNTQDNLASGWTAPIVVNGSAQVNRQSPTVAMDANGDFIVGWRTTYGKDLRNVPQYDLEARRFNPQGGAIDSSPFKVNKLEDSSTISTADETYAKVSMNLNNDNNFAFTYARDNIGGLATSIVENLFTNGPASGSADTIVDSAGDDHKSWVAMNQSGNFVVSWGSGYGSQSNPGVYHIDYRKYNSSNQPTSNATLVSSSRDEDDNNQGPDVSMDANGDFVVSWANHNTSSSSTEEGVWATIYNHSGTVTPVTVVDTGHTISGDVSPDIAPTVGMVQMNQWEGWWGIAWSLPNGSYIDVYTQQFNLAGVGQSSIIQVSTHPPMNPNHNNDYVSIGVDSSGNDQGDNFSMAWGRSSNFASSGTFEELGQSFNDTSSPSLAAGAEARPAQPKQMISALLGGASRFQPSSSLANDSVSWQSQSLLGIVPVFAVPETKNRASAKRANTTTLVST